MYIELGKIFDAGRDCPYKSGDLDERIRLVKKHFPIGIIVSISKDFDQEMIFSGKSATGIVTGYKEVNGHCMVCVKGNEPLSALQISLSKDCYEIPEYTHPGALIYTKEELRKFKIDSLI